MDAVSNASIDVVTTASKYHEVRNEFGLSADYVYRDSQVTLGVLTSHEPDSPPTPAASTSRRKSSAA